LLDIGIATASSYAEEKLIFSEQKKHSDLILLTDNPLMVGARYFCEKLQGEKPAT
jgi:hypothetical protein